MNRRHAVAVLALLGSLDAAYLLLHKLGYIGSLVCTVGSDSCNVVNTSMPSATAASPKIRTRVRLNGLLPLRLVLISDVVSPLS